MPVVQKGWFSSEGEAGRSGKRRCDCAVTCNPPSPHTFSPSSSTLTCPEPTLRERMHSMGSSLSGRGLTLRRKSSDGGDNSIEKRTRDEGDRKRVGKGKSLLVRVDMGGCRT